MPAISILYNPQPLTVYEADGDRAAGALAYFYLARTTTPLTVFIDAPMTTPHTWPVVASAYGLLPPIYIPKGTEYKIQITDALGSILYAADGIDNPPPPTGGDGGDGGLVIDATQIAQTGDFLWQPVDANREGWVRCKGGTISSVAGSGSERAHPDCEALFSFYWNTYPDSIAPVSGGRGANAAADWASAKSIRLLDMRGATAVGLDTMGGPALGRLQVTTTIDTTNAAPGVTVASAAGLAAGMFVIAAGVPAGTKIVSVNGTALTLSANATATATAVPARFSIFSDATVAGAAGGEVTHKLDLFELPEHDHANTATATSTVTDNGHGHTLLSDAATDNRFVIRSATGNAESTYDLTPGAAGDRDAKTGSGIATNSTTGVTVATTVALTNVKSGKSAPINQMPPGVLGTWFCKL